MDDNTHLLLDFGDSVYAQVYGTFASGPRRPELQISASGGSLDVGRGEITVYGDPMLLGMPGGTLTIPVERRLPYVSGVHERLPEPHVYNDIMHLVDCILNDKEPLVTAEHARHVIEIIERGYESAEIGRTLALTTTF
jgi:predicted dehydrogenase